MEEAGDLVGEGAVHVVDEGIEDFGGGREGEDVVVGKTGGDEGGVAFVKKDFFFEVSLLESERSSSGGLRFEV